MLQRYQDQRISKIFSQRKRVAIFTQIEEIVCLFYSTKEEMPEEVYLSLRNIDHELITERMPELERQTKHETVAYLRAISEQIGEENSKYLHKGLTSSDILDTCLALQMKESLEHLLDLVQSFLDTLRHKACVHKHTKMIGRSHGRAGEITTFGLVLLSFYTEWARNKERIEMALSEISFGCISGPMGNFSLTSPKLEEEICKHLGLKHEPVSSQVIPRDRHAFLSCVLSLVGASLERISTEIRNLSQSGIDEISEKFSDKQAGSSAMPHKVNPILSENVTGLGRLLKGYVSPSLDNVSLWYQRDMSHSSVERVTIEDSLHLACFGIKRMEKVIKNMTVYSENMRRNINREKGSFLSHSILYYLMDRGYGRKEAYEITQELTKEENNLIETLNKLKDTYFTSEEIENIVSEEKYISNVDYIFKRTLGG